MHPDAARKLADSALGFIASDDALTAALLNASGASALTLRKMAEDPDFAIFLLDFILETDDRTLAFAAAAGLPPERIIAARAALSGPTENWL